MTTADVLALAATLAAKSGMTDTAIGRYAAGDPKLIFDLRAGRRLRPATATKIARRLIEWRPAK